MQSPERRHLSGCIIIAFEPKTLPKLDAVAIVFVLYLSRSANKHPRSIDHLGLPICLRPKLGYYLFE